VSCAACYSLPRPSTMALRLALIAALASTSHAALELTDETWDQEVVKSGKAAFIKFLAPW